jgi:hypothetical protein
VEDSGDVMPGQHRSATNHCEIRVRQHRQHLFRELRRWGYAVCDGSAFRYARELALVLDYTQWRNFTKVIDKAMTPCNNSGHDIS